LLLGSWWRWSRWLRLWRCPRSTTGCDDDGQIIYGFNDGHVLYGGACSQNGDASRGPDGFLEEERGMLTALVASKSMKSMQEREHR